MKTQVKALKVKIKSLAEEAKIIRLEERRVLKYRKPDPCLYLSLREHRTKDVRSEQRSSLLAYAFIRGKPYHAVEKIGKPHKRTYPDLSRVRQLIVKFGGLPGKPRECSAEEVASWFSAETGKK